MHITRLLDERFPVISVTLYTYIRSTLSLYPIDCACVCVCLSVCLSACLSVCLCLSASIALCVRACAVCVCVETWEWEIASQDRVGQYTSLNCILYIVTGFPRYRFSPNGGPLALPILTTEISCDQGLQDFTDLLWSTSRKYNAQCVPSLYGYRDLAIVQDLVDSNNR